MHGVAQRTRALRHPVFAGSLVLLLLNDHVLKGAGVLPGALTGKLSDVAGMIVAPVLAVALLGLRRDGARALAFGGVALFFALLQLAPGFAHGYDALLRALGLASVTVSDPTDLIALAVLPIAWWIVRAGDRAAPARGLALASQRALLGAALFACVATTNPPPPPPASWNTDAWLHNRTETTIDVRIRWVDDPMACDVLALSTTDVAAALGPDAFGEGITFRLDPGDTVPIEPIDARAALTRTFTGGGRPIPMDGETRHPCEAVRISVDGLDDQVAFWVAGTAESVLTNLASDPASDEIGARGIAIDEDPSGDDGLLRVVPGRSYRVAPLRAVPPPVRPECRESRGQTVAFSAPSAADVGVVWTVEHRALLPDGCTELDLIDGARSATRTLFLCVPGDAIPFDVGARVELTSRSATDLEVGSADDATRLRLFGGAPQIDAAGVSITPGAIDLGCGERLPCGAFVAPIALRDRSGGAVEVDALVDAASTEGTTRRFVVTRAEHVILANADCDAGRDRIGAHLDAVIVDTIPATPEPMPFH